MKIYSVDAGGRHPVHGAYWAEAEQRWNPCTWDMWGFFVGENWPRSVDLVGRFDAV